MDRFHRNILPSKNTKAFGTRAGDDAVRIWDSGSLQLLAAVDAEFCGDAHRLIIDSQRKMVFSGKWRDGVTCYDYANKRVLWHRSDLPGIQRLDLSDGFPSSVFVEVAHLELGEGGMEGTPVDIVELDIATGDLKAQIFRGDRMFLHPNRNLMLAVDRSEKVLRILDDRGKEMGIVDMEYFSVLDVAFTDELLAVSEGKEGVRIMDFRGNILATHKSQSREINCLKVAFIGRTDVLAIMDSWAGTFMTLVDCDGRVVTEYKRQVHVGIRYIRNGTHFVDEAGDVCATATGVVEARVAP